jgi:hypothetical protein
MQIGSALTERGKQKMIELQIDTDMPNGCKECRFKGYKDGKWYCIASKVPMADECLEQRPFWCKLQETEKMYSRFTFKSQLCDGHVHLTAKDFIDHKVAEGHMKQQMKLKKYANNPALCEDLREMLYQQIYNINQLQWYRKEWMDLLNKYRKIRDNSTIPVVEPEIEGGGCSWWYVCSECHTSISPGDKYCRQCGGKVEWK